MIYQEAQGRRFQCSQGGRVEEEEDGQDCKTIHTCAHGRHVRYYLPISVRVLCVCVWVSINVYTLCVDMYLHAHMHTYIYAHIH